MTQDPDYGRTWDFVGVDQDGNEADRRRLSDMKDAMTWFQHYLQGDTQEITINIVTASGEEKRAVLRRSVAED